MYSSLLNSFDIYIIKRETSMFGLFSNYKLHEMDIKYTIVPFEENEPFLIYNDKKIFNEEYNLLLSIKKICNSISIDNSSNILILEENIVFHNNFSEKLKEKIDLGLFDSNDIIYFGDNLQKLQDNGVSSYEKSGFYTIDKENGYNITPFYAVLLKPEIIPLIKDKLNVELNSNTNIHNIERLLWDILHEKNKKAIVFYPNLIIYPNLIENLNDNDNDNDTDFSIDSSKNVNLHYLSDYKYVSSTLYWHKICHFVLSNKLSLRKMNINIDNSLHNVDLSKIIENGNKSFVFIIPSFNNSLYYKKNLDSVFIQKYPFWRIIYVDDCSTDNTYDLVKNYIIEKDFGKKVTLVKNKKNMKQTYSRYIAYNMCQPDEICCMLDGDDWLLNEDVLINLNNSYLNEKLLVSYGQFYYYENDKIANLSGYYSYSDEEIQNNNYRDRWVSQHLRTCEASLLHTIPKNYLKFNNEWIKCCSDLAEMWWVLEKSQGRHANVGYPVYVYNKDASMTYENSYFNKNKNIVWGLYREGVIKYLKEYKCN